jgi:hypothetical protein
MRAETSRFLHWLEWYSGIEVDAARGKSSLVQYYSLPDADALIDILQDNRKMLSRAIGSAFHGEVAKEFEDSVGKVGRIQQSLEKTDCLIDAMVECAYGLSPRNVGVFPAGIYLRASLAGR